MAFGRFLAANKGGVPLPSVCLSVVWITCEYLCRRAANGRLFSLRMWTQLYSYVFCALCFNVRRNLRFILRVVVT